MKQKNPIPKDARTSVAEMLKELIAVKKALVKKKILSQGDIDECKK